MNKKIVNTAGCILIIVSFIFLARRFIGINVDWRLLFSPAALILLIVMPFFNVIIIFLNSCCWGNLLVLFTSQLVLKREVFAVYAKSNLAKYLPGNVGHYAARQMYASQIGLRQMHIALASIFEIGYSACAMSAVSLLFSADTVISLLRNQLDNNIPMLSGIIIAAILAVFLVMVFIFHRNKYVREIISLTVNPHFWLTIFGSFLLSAVSAFVIGIMFVIIVCQYHTIEFSQAFLLIGGCTASYFIGFITPGVPGGIGVREAAMLLLLGPSFPDDRILLAAMIQRLSMIIGDAAAFLISHLLKNNLYLNTFIV